MVYSISNTPTKSSESPVDLETIITTLEKEIRRMVEGKIE